MLVAGEGKRPVKPLQNFDMLTIGRQDDISLYCLCCKSATVGNLIYGVWMGC